KSQAQAQPDKRGTDEQPLVVKTLPAEKSETDHAHEAEEKAAKARETSAKERLDTDLVNYTGKLADYTLGLFVATVALVVATVATLLIGVFQLKHMRREFIAAHRPRMKVREFNHIADGGNAIRWTLSNVGGSKAIIRGVRATTRLTKADDDLPAPDYSRCEEITTMTAFEPGNLDEQVTLRLPANWGYDSARWLYVFGYVAYGDELGNGFQTAFIRRHDWPRGRFVPVNDPDYEHED
ncbi:MAG: hypothetical protein Q8L22_10070, partial [Reyranella sp.]|nr:hypothetical protein [Reyranella sp.]